MSSQIPDFRTLAFEAPVSAARRRRKPAPQAEGKGETLGDAPGFPPYRRGPYLTMYTTRPWTLRQYAGFGSVEESNAFYKQALAEGQRGLSVAFDLPTHLGYDSDHPRALGDVGQAGVAIDTLEDMQQLFADIPLDRVSVSMTMNGAALPILALFVAAAESRGLSRAALSGTLQNDILKEFMVRNTVVYPPAPSMRIVGDIMRYCARAMPKFHALSISGYHMHEAGATPELELAYTLADGLEYVRKGLEVGLAIDEFAPRLSFFWAIGMDFYLEVAKLRAARVMWAELMSAFAPRDPRSSMLRAHCQTSGFSLSAQDPFNNIIRTCIEAVAAVQGQTQSLHTNAFDEALALPSDFSARIARSTQHLLQHETYMTRVIDPWGGSFFMEALTDALRQRARVHLDEIEALGGMTRALATGLPKARIEEAALRTQAEFDSQERIKVGVNRYPMRQEIAFPLRSLDAQANRERQVQKLQAWRSQRDEEAVRKALDALRQAAEREGEALVEPCIEAARCGATLGEMSGTLEEVFGRHRPEAKVTSMGTYREQRASEVRFQGLLERVERFAQHEGRRPRILVAKLGLDGHDRGQKVVASSFADLGFDVDLGPLFQSAEEVAMQAIDNDVHVVGVNSLSAGHRVLVPRLCEALRAQGRSDIRVVVGGVVPPQEQELLRSAGVAAIFGSGTDILDAAATILDLLESSDEGSEGE